MRLNKTRNTARNVFFGVLLKLYQILVPFAFRSVMIHVLGAEYLGLGSLFTSVLSVLNLAELGVGSAMVFSMYRPIAEDDGDRIRALMRLYKIYYRVIGAVVLGVGLALLPAIPMLIDGALPEGVSVQALYLINLGATVLSYWLFSYKSSVLRAHQRNDVISKVTLLTDTVRYGLQLAALLVFRNYYYYLMCMLLGQLLNNVVTAAAAHRMYPQYTPRGTLPKDEVRAINRRVADMFTAKLGGTIVNSADAIVISAFLGLTLLAQYQNYFTIVSAVIAFIGIINTSAVAGFGNSMLLKSPKENYEDFEVFAFLEFWIIGFCICCFSALAQPFMRLWMGEGMLLDDRVVWLLCAYFFGHEIEKLLSMFKDAGGIWHEDRFRPLIYGLSNLAANVLLVRWIGLDGVMLSTILSVFLISLPWIVRNVFVLVFKRSPKRFLLQLLQYTLGIVLAALLTNFLCGLIPGAGIPALLARAAVCAGVSNAVFLVLYFRTGRLRRAKTLAARLLRRGGR